MNDTSAARDWVAATAVPLPQTGAPQALTDTVGEAVVVGFGESTRASHEILDLGHRLLRQLVEDKGFRALALSDDESVIAELDRFLRTGDGDLAASLSHAFVPWRITELVDILEWMRDFNRRHPGDQVRVFGLEPAAVRLNHYDEVLEQVRATDAALAGEVEARYAVLRSAHRVPEHVQTAQGVHPGRPFVELAREVVALLEPHPRQPGLAGAKRIAVYHGSTVAAGYDFEAGNRRAARAVIDWHEATGHRILYWEGMAHTANAPEVGIRQMRSISGNPGSRLRERFGAGYVSIVAGFDHGRIHAGVRVPVAPDEFADAVLGSAPLDVYLLDLRGPKPEPVARWLSGQHRLRVIAGVYQAEDDAEHYLTGGPLDGWFDVVVRFGEITPTTML